MSHTTTQETPQWAIDAATAIYDDEEFRPVGSIAKIGSLPDEQKRLAAIIARHAPTLDGLIARHDPALGAFNRAAVSGMRARIAELEAENARLLEAFRRIRKARSLSDAVLIAVVSGSEGPFITAQE